MNHARHLWVPLALGIAALLAAVPVAAQDAASSQLLRGAPRGAVAWAQLPGQPSREDLARAQAQLRQLLGVCTYNPHATPYGLEHEAFDTRVAFGPSGAPMFVDVVRHATHRRDAAVTRCVQRRWASLATAPFAATAPVVVAFPLGGTWH